MALAAREPMHKLYFPACKIEGEIEPPVPFNYMGIAGAVPNKCGSCKYLFEGGCTRYMEEVNRYLHLDYGPCDINGSTDPVVYEDEYIKGKVEVPRKCSSYHFLKVGASYGFYCSKDKEKWGNYGHGSGLAFCLKARPDHANLCGSVVGNPDRY